jgi:hypothetical protein
LAETRQRLSRITSEVLYGPDLNKIAATLRKNQQAGISAPSEPREQIFIDDKGDIFFGNQADRPSAERLSRVTQETFYASRLERLTQERAFAESNMPEGTAYASDGEFEGWTFEITNEFDDSYSMFLWFEPASGTYKVSLVRPQLGGAVDMHECHIYKDGVICLKKEGGPGYSRMADAYARSALWTRGASCYRRGYGFQFNMDQAS